MRYEKLLEEFRSVSSNPSSIEPTVFDICGNSHYENVVSNVLQFYLDSSGPHNLGDLVVSSLIKAASLDDKISDNQFTVEREVRTKNGKFIDLLLTNDSTCIVVENKIYADLYNDLREYLECGYARASEVFGLVLSPFKLQVEHPNFILVTYTEFFKELRSQYGNYLNQPRMKYLSLLFDLVENIERITMGTQFQNEDFLQFVKENNDEVQRLSSELKRFHDDLRRQVKSVIQFVSDKELKSVEKQFPWRNLPELYDIAVTDFCVDGVIVALDAKLSVNGWEFGLFYRNPGNGEKVGVGELCEAKGFKGNLIGTEFVLNDTLGLQASVQEVGERISEIVKAFSD